MSEKLWHAKSFELRSSGSFSRSRGVKFLLRDPFTSLENLGFMPIANYPPGPSPHHICVRHTIFVAQLISLFKANFQASIFSVMSWLRGLLRCPTCLEVASTCFRDTRSVIKQAGFLPCFPQESPVDFVILMFQIICKNISLPDRPLCRRPAHPDDPEYLQKMSYQRQP